MTFNAHSADLLRERLHPELAPDYLVTAAPWCDEDPSDPSAVHCVTVWEPTPEYPIEGEARCDIFEVGATYVVREVGSRAVLGRTTEARALPALIRAALRSTWRVPREH